MHSYYTSNKTKFKLNYESMKHVADNKNCHDNDCSPSSCESPCHTDGSGNRLLDSCAGLRPRSVSRTPLRLRSIASPAASGAGTDPSAGNPNPRNRRLRNRREEEPRPKPASWVAQPNWSTSRVKMARFVTSLPAFSCRQSEIAEAELNTYYGPPISKVRIGKKPKAVLLCRN